MPSSPALRKKVGLGTVLTSTTTRERADGAGRLAVVALLMVVGVILLGCDGGQVRQDNADRRGPAATAAAGRNAVAREAPVGQTSTGMSQAGGSSACAVRNSAETGSAARIGSFRPPDRVPRHEIFVVTEGGKDADRGKAKIVELLVDTGATGEADYELIARDIKAKYAAYDAATVEFTDLSGRGIPYNGGALIFNTACGALWVGYVYGPPNADGYVVATGAPPPLYPAPGETGLREDQSG